MKKVILLEDVPKLGYADDIVEVKPGYANNYLIRQGLAMEATPQKLHEARQKSAARRAEEERNRGAAEELAARLNGQSFQVEKTTGEEGRLYGSLTTMDVQNVLAENGFEVERRGIEIVEELKTVGTTPVKIRLMRGVEAEFTVEIVSDKPEERAAEAEETAKVEETAEVEETTSEEAAEGLTAEEDAATEEENAELAE